MTVSGWLPMAHADLVQLVETDLSPISSCPLNQPYWGVIGWFFERATHVEFTEIVQHSRSEAANEMVRRLMESKFINLHLGHF